MRAPDGHGVPTDDAPTVDADEATGQTPTNEQKPLTTEEQAAKDAADEEAAEAKDAADEEAAEAKDKAKAEFKPHGAPEGDYELTMPEGVELDKSMLEAFNPVAKELDLSNAGAQKVAEFFIEKVQPQIAEQFVKGIEADVENQKADWAKTTKELIVSDAQAEKPEDRVFDGSNFEAVTKTSARALDRFGSPELRQLLDASGLGNNPEVVKFTYKIGKLIGEDNDFQRGGHVPQPKSREEKYYGTK
ncbi:MAG: hypothetical protein ACRCWJ_15090 [Casimicrobium sp.]